jgi:hypothetical protein
MKADVRRLPNQMPSVRRVFVGPGRGRLPQSPRVSASIVFAFVPISTSSLAASTCSLFRQYRIASSRICSPSSESFLRVIFLLHASRSVRSTQPGRFPFVLVTHLTCIMRATFKSARPTFAVFQQFGLRMAHALAEPEFPLVSAFADDNCRVRLLRYGAVRSSRTAVSAAHAG